MWDRNLLLSSQEAGKLTDYEKRDLGWRLVLGAVTEKDGSQAQRYANQLSKLSFDHDQVKVGAGAAISTLTKKIGKLDASLSSPSSPSNQRLASPPSNVPGG